MRGSLLMTFDELVDAKGGTYYEVSVNGDLRQRNYSEANNQYSTFINVDDVVTVYIENNQVTGETYTVIRRDYTTDDTDGNMGIIDTTLIAFSGGTGATLVFTATTVNNAYKFEYRVDASVGSPLPGDCVWAYNEKIWSNNAIYWGSCSTTPPSPTPTPIPSKEGTIVFINNDPQDLYPSSKLSYDTGQSFTPIQNYPGQSFEVTAPDLNFAAVNYDGSVITAVSNYCGIWKTLNSGTTWNIDTSLNSTSGFTTYARNDISPSGEWQSMAITDRFPNLTGGTYYYSNNYGQSWNAIPSSNKRWTQTVMITEGFPMYGVAGIYQETDKIYKITGATSAPVAISSIPSRTWNNLAVSANGQIMLAVHQPVQGVSPQPAVDYSATISYNGGLTWSEILLASTTNIDALVDPKCAMSADGTYMYIANGFSGAQGGYIYRSSNSGVTWTRVSTSNQLVNVANMSISCSKSGQYVYASSFPNSVQTYYSSDYGATWTHLGFTNNGPFVVQNKFDVVTPSPTPTPYPAPGTYSVEMVYNYSGLSQTARVNLTGDTFYDSTYSFSGLTGSGSVSGSTSALTIPISGCGANILSADAFRTICKTTNGPLVITGTTKQLYYNNNLIYNDVDTFTLPNPTFEIPNCTGGTYQNIDFAAQSITGLSNGDILRYVISDGFANGPISTGITIEYVYNWSNSLRSWHNVDFTVGATGAFGPDRLLNNQTFTGTSGTFSGTTVIPAGEIYGNPYTYVDMCGEFSTQQIQNCTISRFDNGVLTQSGVTTGRTITVNCVTKTRVNTLLGISYPQNSVIRFVIDNIFQPPPPTPTPTPTATPTPTPTPTPSIPPTFQYRYIATSNGSSVNKAATNMTATFNVDGGGGINTYSRSNLTWTTSANNISSIQNINVVHVGTNSITITRNIMKTTAGTVVLDNTRWRLFINSVVVRTLNNPANRTVPFTPDSLAEIIRFDNVVINEGDAVLIEVDDTQI